MSLWAENYFADATSTAFQNLYDNYDNLQTSFVKHWQYIARKFMNISHVLGYEFINGKTQH